jgi:HIV Tat-specific factor 1
LTKTYWNANKPPTPWPESTKRQVHQPHLHLSLPSRAYRNNRYGTSLLLQTPAAPVLARENKKRKEPENYTSANPTASTSADEPSAKRGKKDKSAQEKKPKNTAVYVTGLPPDTELDELEECFSKYGVLEEDDEGQPKIKMYAKDDGSFSGEALIVYFKEDSVTLALNILDESELRLGDASSLMKVVKADFTHKQSNGGGSHNGQERRVVDKKKATRRIGKMQKWVLTRSILSWQLYRRYSRKINEWNDEDGFGPSLEPEDDINMANKNSRVVVLKHMFTLQELEEDATLLLDLKEDVREECSTLGEVTNVVLYDVSAVVSHETLTNVWLPCRKSRMVSWPSSSEMWPVPMLA